MLFQLNSLGSYRMFRNHWICQPFPTFKTWGAYRNMISCISIS